MKIGIYSANFILASCIKTVAKFIWVHILRQEQFFLSNTCFQNSVTFAIYMFLYQIGTVPSIAAA